MPEEPAEAYERGVRAGGIDERLAGHDRRLDSINGNLADIAGEMRALSLSNAKELQTLVLAVQSLRDQAVADAQTRVTTASAVEKSRKETADAVESERVVRRERSDTAWSPIAKALAILGAVVAVVGAVVGLYLAQRR